MLKDKWVDRKNGVDINSADDINQVAHAVVDLERKIENGVLSAEVHVGASAPVNSELLWVDTDEEDEEDNEEPLAAAPPDFAANEGEDGYIKNRTHYVDEKGVIHKLPNKFIDADWMATSQENIDNSIVIPGQKLTGTATMWSKRNMDIQPGITYDVHINDVVYPCVATNEGGGISLGNNTSLNKNNLPFCVYWAGGSATSGMFFTDGTLGSSVYLKVTGHSWTDYNKLPEEFLPECVVKTVNGAKPDEKGNVQIKTGGGADIDVTATVGQTIIVKEVDENGKPTKWRAADYQPKICGEEEMDFLGSTELSFVFMEENGIYVSSIPCDKEFVEGVVYKVTFDDVTYENTYDPETNAIGNIGLMTGGESTGEPYIITIADGMMNVLCFAEISTATLGIKYVGTKTIDIMYMPELPHFDISERGSLYTNGGQFVVMPEGFDAYLEQVYAYGRGRLTAIVPVNNYDVTHSNETLVTFTVTASKKAGKMALDGHLFTTFVHIEKIGDEQLSIKCFDMDTINF